MTPMAESSDPTVAGTANDLTDFLLPPRPRDLSLAWSEDEDDGEGEPTWGEAIADVALPLFLMALAGLVIIAACWGLMELHNAVQG